MIEFKEVTLQDREWMNQCFKEADLKGCEYCFAGCFIWRNAYNTKVAFVDGFCCMISGKESAPIYTFPAGKGDLKAVIQTLWEDAKSRNVTFTIRALTEEQAKFINETFDDAFEITTNRGESDYIYTVEKLSNLSGKKLHGKRNHIARFKDNPNWSYEPITSENIEDCLIMNEKWRQKYNSGEEDGLDKELRAVKEAFEHFSELKLQGGLIRREGEVVAYSIGEPLSSDTFVVHIEKAFADIQGAYPIMNQQFVLNNCQDFTYVNREEDMGDEGLRKAKLSYYPDILLDKFTARAK